MHKTIILSVDTVTCHKPQGTDNRSVAAQYMDAFLVPPTMDDPRPPYAFNTDLTQRGNSSINIAN